MGEGSKHNVPPQAPPASGVAERMQETRRGLHSACAAGLHIAGCANFERTGGYKFWVLLG